jgi:hypothetical protein
MSGVILLQLEALNDMTWPVIYLVFAHFVNQLPESVQPDLSVPVGQSDLTHYQYVLFIIIITGAIFLCMEICRNLLRCGWLVYKWFF